MTPRRPGAGAWREIRVGELVRSGALMIGDGYRVRNTELGPEGIPFVRGGDIGDGIINTDTVDHIRPEYTDRVQAKLTRPGDSAFITKGTVGRAGRLRHGQPAAVFAPQVAYWRTLDPNVLDAGFIFQLMRSPQFQAALHAVKAHGSMVADYVSLSQQMDFVLRVPGIRDQRFIASMLGALDDKIEVNRRMGRTLEEMAQAIFTSWFVDFDGHTDLVPSEIGPVPRGWQVVPLDQIAEYRNGLPLQRFPAVVGASTLPALKIRELQSGITAATDRVAASVPPEYVVDDGDIIFSWSGTLVVRQWAEGRAALNQHLFRVLPRKLPAWACYLWTVHHLPHFRRVAAGKATTMGHINRGHLAEVRVVIPPDATLRAMSTQMEPLCAREVLTRVESRTIAVLRDLLLPKLIAGEIRIPDAEKLVGEAT